MTERRQFVGHASTAEADQFTGLSRELSIDMQAETIRVHDGNTPGGFPLARADMANVSNSVLDARIASKESTANKTNVISKDSTSEQYPNAKAVFEALRGIFATGDIKQSVQASNHGNWLLCNGQAVSRADYPELFAVIGVTFGSGDGTTTFNVPDYQGKFLRGLGGASASGFGETQPEGLPNITGSIGNLNNVGGESGAFYKGSSQWYMHVSGGDSTGHNAVFDASRSSSIYGASEHVTPVNQAVNYFIYSA